MNFPSSLPPLYKNPSCYWDNDVRVAIVFEKERAGIEAFSIHGRGNVDELAKFIIAAQAAIPEPLSADDPAAVDRACDAVAAALGDAYDCTRVWSAWGVGTMSRDDFTSVAEDSDRVNEIAIAALRAAQVPASSDQAGEPRDQHGRTFDMLRGTINELDRQRAELRKELEFERAEVKRLEVQRDTAFARAEKAGIEAVRLGNLAHELRHERDAARSDAERLAKALRFEIDHLTKYDSGSTHFIGCEAIHPRCAALMRMRKAFTAHDQAGKDTPVGGEKS